MPKPFSESCEQNKLPILGVLQQEFAHTTHVLEIGSGTGQHAVFFAAQLPHLTWQSSDVLHYHSGINAWIDEFSRPNLLRPIELDVARSAWPQQPFDGVFSANTAHIMSWPQVIAMFTGVGRLLGTGGKFILYGPFNYDGRYTSESNARFDAFLKQRDPLSGIRDITDLEKLAREQRLELINDHDMPVNNRSLVWQRINT